MDPALGTVFVTVRDVKEHVEADEARNALTETDAWLVLA